MRDRVLTLPEVIFLGATRGMLGAGLGLLVSERLGRDQRRVAGRLLTAIGVVTTIPALMALCRGAVDRGAAPSDAARVARGSTMTVEHY